MLLPLRNRSASQASRALIEINSAVDGSSEVGRAELDGLRSSRDGPGVGGGGGG